MKLKRNYLSNQNYRPDVDGLRAIAIISVIIYHSFPNLMNGGFIGVDIFFVISGFLITTMILGSLNKGSFSFSEFYGRRILRLFPALILVLYACFICGLFTLLADEFKQLAKQIISGASFYANYMFWQESGYFDSSVASKPLLHLWSLSLEEQFYFIWPFVLWFTRKFNFKLILITVFMGIASFLLNLKIGYNDIIAAFYLPHTRAWEFLFGCLIALVLEEKWRVSFLIFNKNSNDIPIFEYGNNKPALLKYLSNLISVVGLMLLLWGIFYINKDLSYPGKWTLVPVLGTGLLLIAGSSGWVNQMILSTKPFVWLGLISYPLYLWHWPILSFANIIESGTPDKSIRIVALVISIFFAWLTYFLLEVPMRIRKNVETKIMVLIILMFSLFLISYLSFQSLWVLNDNVSRHNNSEEIGWILPGYSGEEVKWCKERLPDRVSISKDHLGEDFCILQKNSEPNVLLVGDSMNFSLYPGLVKFADYNILVLAAGAAAPFYNVRTAGTGDSKRVINYKLINQALDYAILNKNIKVVVMATVASLDLALESSNFKIANVLNPNEKNAKSIFSASFAITLKKLLKAGKSVIYVLPNPTLSYDINSCSIIDRPFRLPGFINKTCTEEASQFFQIGGGQIFKDWVMGVLKDFPQVKVFDPANTFCDRDNCFAAKNGKLLYRDKVHLSISGSDLVGPQLHSLIVQSL